VFDDLYFVDLV